MATQARLRPTQTMAIATWPRPPRSDHPDHPDHPDQTTQITQTRPPRSPRSSRSDRPWPDHSLRTSLFYPDHPDHPDHIPFAPKDYSYRGLDFEKSHTHNVTHAHWYPWALNCTASMVGESPGPNPAHDHCVLLLILISGQSQESQIRG